MDKPANELVSRLLESYRAHDRLHHLGSIFLPSRVRAIEIIELLRRLFFPGFFDDYRLNDDNIERHASELLADIQELLNEQIRQSLRYNLARQSEGQTEDYDDCDVQARHLTQQFLESIPELRRLVATDVEASFQGDPAAVNTDETIFCYPGIDAIFTYRVAHRLHELGIPMLPRIMSEYAHNETGIDIHPGAKIGESFFIDHGTGVVIGETTEIGQRVKLYQGVTLGALSTKGGQDWRGRKRHPTIEDDVTIYGGAIILGGSTVIGAGATIGGSVFITSSIPAGHTVTMKLQELDIRPPKNRKKG